MKKELLQRLILIFIWAFILNFLWENLHSFLYLHYQNSPITQWILFKASLTDALIILFLGSIFIKINYFRQRQWLVLILALVIALLNELYALKTGRWAYNELMPLVPIFQTGLTPTIQLAILSYLTFRLVGLR